MVLKIQSSPCPSSIGITLNGNLLEMQTARPKPIPVESEILHLNLQVCVAISPPGNSETNSSLRITGTQQVEKCVSFCRSKARDIVYSILIWNEDIQLKNNHNSHPQANMFYFYELNKKTSCNERFHLKCIFRYQFPSSLIIYNTFYSPKKGSL